MDNRYFQFLAGERKGEILTFDKIEQEDEIIFISFKDGSRCNEEFILPLNETAWEGKLMAEISDPNNYWKISEEWIGRELEKWETNKDGEKVCVQPFEPGRKKIIAIPPRKTKAKFSDVNNETTQSMKPTQQYNNDPVWIMADKSKKFDTKVSLDLVISLPSKSLFNVANESFENGGVKIIEYIISNLDDTKIKNSLRSSLLAAYEVTGTSLFEPYVIEKEIIGEPQLQKNDENNE